MSRPHTPLSPPTSTRRHRIAPGPPARVRAPGRVPWGVLGMLGLMVAIESFVARHPLDFSDPVSLNWQLGARAARDEGPGCSILCLGDSLVKHAVMPKVVAAHTGRRVVNLALARGPAPATFFLLRRALEAGTRPEAIVVDFKPSVLVGSPRYNLRYWQEIVSPRECLELARTSGGGSLPTSIVLGRLLPTFRSRLEVRDALLAALRGEVPPMRPINRVCRRNWRVNDGANVGARNPAFTGEVGPDEHRMLLSHLWYCHRANAAHVRRLLDLTAARGIRVYWLLPPLSPQLQARREQSGAEAGYLRFIQSMHARYRHLTIVDGRHASYDHTLFVDATHLNGQGANTLSTDLAALLDRDRAALVPGPRWVDLPAYRPRPVIVPLEDVEQSRRVLSISQGASTFQRRKDGQG
jgi:hypothetical protein